MVVVVAAVMVVVEVNTRVLIAFLFVISPTPPHSLHLACSLLLLLPAVVMMMTLISSEISPLVGR